MGDYNIEMLKKEGETLSQKKANELSNKLSPIIDKFRENFEILMDECDNNLNAEEIIYFRRNMIYNILKQFNQWKVVGDCVPDYIKIKRDKILLLTVKKI